MSKGLARKKPKKKPKKKDNDRVANSPLYLNIFSYQDSEQILVLNIYKYIVFFSCPLINNLTSNRRAEPGNNLLVNIYAHPSSLFVLFYIWAWNIR